jgi:hypothetical protein
MLGLVGGILPSRAENAASYARSHPRLAQRGQPRLSAENFQRAAEACPE